MKLYRISIEHIELTIQLPRAFETCIKAAGSSLKSAVWTDILALSRYDCLVCPGNSVSHHFIVHRFITFRILHKAMTCKQAPLPSQSGMNGRHLVLPAACERKNWDLKSLISFFDLGESQATLAMQSHSTAILLPQHLGCWFRTNLHQKMKKIGVVQLRQFQ